MAMKKKKKIYQSKAILTLTGLETISQKSQLLVLFHIKQQPSHLILKEVNKNDLVINKSKIYDTTLIAKKAIWIKLFLIKIRLLNKNS